MANGTRRGTYIVNRFPENAPVLSRSGIDQQNLMRLKVNRIALIQEIKVEHLVPPLITAGVLNMEDDQNIQKAASAGGKARTLIDILPTKPASSEWFKHFRNALKNPDADTETKQRYRILVEFLDNTVIHRPSSQSIHLRNTCELENFKYPKYDPLPAITEHNQPQSQSQDTEIIGNSTFDKETTNGSEPERESSDDQPELDLESSGLSSNSHCSMTLIKGFIHQWVSVPDSFKSQISLPDTHKQLLLKSKYPEDDEQLEDEKRALQKIKKLEFVASLVRMKQLPLGFELCLSDILQDILNKSNLYHLYLKYFKMLHKVDINLVTEITKSFQSLVNTVKVAKTSETMEQIVNTGFKIMNFFIEMEFFNEAEHITNILLEFLNTNPNTETWMAKFKCCIKLMHIRNSNYNFSGAGEAYFSAVQMTWAISQMSFGQNTLHMGEMYSALSLTLLEDGAISSGYSWINKALQEVPDNSWAQIINTLCTAVIAYTSKWQVKRAELVAVQCVQLARLHFGKSHPLYLKALLHFCHFSSEFLQDQAGVKVAFKTLELSQKLYGCETLQQALAHRAVSKALMVMHQFDSSEHYQHAMESVRIARLLLPEDHPMLNIFFHTFSLSLQWKAAQDPEELQSSTFLWAEAEAKHALSIVLDHYGAVSLRSAQVYSLLGQVYAKMAKYEQAEEKIKKSFEYMKLCQPADSNYLLLSMATLGTFYTLLERPNEAIPLLKHVADTVESNGFYLKWVHVCYDNLISLLQATDNIKVADLYSDKLSDWLQSNPKHKAQITLDMLDNQPMHYKKLISVLDKWGIAVEKVQQQADQCEQDQ